MLTHSTYLLLFYLALAVGLFNTSLAVILIVRNKRNLIERSDEILSMNSNTSANTETTKNKTAIEDTITADTTRKVINIGSRIALYVVLVAGGYIWRVLEQYSSITTIEHVTIVERLADTTEGFEQYTFRLATSPKIWRTNICDDRRVGFSAGMQFDEWTYERRLMCWSFAPKGTGFTFSKNYIAKGE